MCWGNSSFVGSIGDVSVVDTGEILDKLNENGPMTYEELIKRLRSGVMVEDKVDSLIRTGHVLLDVNTERVARSNVRNHMITWDDDNEEKD